MYKEKQLRIRKDKITISFFLEVLYRYPLLPPQAGEQPSLKQILLKY